MRTLIDLLLFLVALALLNDCMTHGGQSYLAQMAYAFQSWVEHRAASMPA